jgi:hypothetical protein
VWQAWRVRWGGRDEWYAVVIKIRVLGNIMDQDGGGVSSSGCGAC